MLAVPASGVTPRCDPQKPAELPLPGDGDLVRRFVAGDSAAFEGLVRRHGPMVFGVCRRMLRNPHDADDAFQATFLVLLRRAGSVRPPERVGHWLYGVACRTAAKANSMKLRRTQKEHEAPPRMPSPPGDYRGELRSMLDAELARMPERYRAPIVMCELDGMSRREAAEVLRLPEGTLSSRLARARDLLRTRLTRRGVALSAGALVAGLTAESASASASVPAALLASVGKGTIVASSVAGAVPEHVALLAQGVIKAMWISKLQSVVAATVIVGTLGAGASVATHHVITREKEAAAAKADGKGDQKPAAAENGKGPGKKDVTAPPTITTSVQAIDAAAGTITAYLPVSEKGAPPATLKLAKEVAVELAGVGKGAPATAGTLADVTSGLNVSLRRSDDSTTVTHILVLGENVRGTIKSVDAAGHTITVEKRDKSGQVDKTLPLHANARISYAGGGKTKGEPVLSGEFSDLKPGAHVSISISADRKSLTYITIEGRNLSGTVSSVNAATRSITVSLKGSEDETLTIAPDAVIVVGSEKGQSGTLSEVAAGMSVNIGASPRDPKIAVTLRAWTPAPSVKGEK